MTAYVRWAPWLAMIFGVIGLSRLPVRELPDIDPPIVSVTTVYPGANAQVVETEVSERLEEVINPNQQSSPRCKSEQSTLPHLVAAIQHKPPELHVRTNGVYQFDRFGILDA